MRFFSCHRLQIEELISAPCIVFAAMEVESIIITPSTNLTSWANNIQAINKNETRREKKNDLHQAAFLCAVPIVGQHESNNNTNLWTTGFVAISA